MKIQFCAYGGGHVTAVLPVIKMMLDRGHDCEFLALTTAGGVAETAGVYHQRPIDYVDIDDPVIAHWGTKLAQLHHTEGKGISLQESIAYLGVSFKDLASDMGEASAWKRYQLQGLNAFCPVYFMRTVLRKEKPDVVVATTSPRMEKAILRAAYQLRIPSLCMVELFGLMEETWLSRPDNGHVMAVSRSEVANRMAAEGRQAKDIFLTGSPMFDQLSRQDGRELRVLWQKKHDVPVNKKVVFWAEQPEPLDPELPRKVRNHLADVCRKNGWLLAIRLHPSSTDESKETVPYGCIQSSADESLLEVIHSSDVVVTLTSTVGWEGLLSDKPLLVFNISPNSHAVTYGDDDGALALDSLEDAEKGLSILLSENEESLALQGLRRCLPKPGGATKRVCDLIEEKVFARKLTS
ncbi:MAG: hypothetical protein ACJASL_000609 [Paraglaciecola sp.]